MLADTSLRTKTLKKARSPSSRLLTARMDLTTVWWKQLLSTVG